MRFQILKKVILEKTLPLALNIPIVRYSSASDSERKQSWRTPWHQQEGEWYSAFKLFAPEKGMGPDVIKFLQSPIDFRPKTIHRWWQRKKEMKAIFDQRYIPERHEILGNDLASAHFIVHRGGSVKFCGHTEWIKKSDDGEYKLPDRYQPDMYLEAIDASNMAIYYEGLGNLIRLEHLRWLSFNNCPHFDDWCIDRISGEVQSSLEYLDLSNCANVTERGLSALYRLEKLKTLKVHNISNSKAFQLTCLLLEDIKPNLKIEGVKYIEIEEVKAN